MKNPGYASVKRRSPPDRVRDEAGVRARRKDLPVSSERLMECVLERENLLKALRQVNTVKSAHGPWRLSRSPALAFALPGKYFFQLGLPQLYKRSSR